MKALRRSTYGKIALSLALIVSVLLLTSIYAGVFAVSTLYRYQNELIHWEIALGDEKERGIFYINQTDAVIPQLQEHLAIKNQKIISSPYVDKAVTLIFIDLVPGRIVGLGNRSCINISRVLGSTALVLVSGLNSRTPYFYWSSTPSIYSYPTDLLSNITKIPYNTPSYQESLFLEDTLKYFTTPQDIHGLPVNLEIPYETHYIVISADIDTNTIQQALRGIEKAGLDCGYEIYFKTSWMLTLTDIPSNYYLSPSDPHQSLANLKAIAFNLTQITEGSTAMISEVEKKVESIFGLTHEMTLRSLIFTFPALGLVLVALPYFSNISFQLNKKLFTILKVRGLYGKKFFLSLLRASSHLSLISIGTVVIFSLFLFSVGLPLTSTLPVTLLALIFVSASALLIIIIYTYLVWKKTTSLKIVDGLRTTLEVPSELKRMRTAGWISLLVGLYFTFAGFAGFSITTYTLLNFISSPLLGLLAYIENILIYFAPLLIAFGATELLISSFPEVSFPLLKAFGEKNNLLNKLIIRTLRRKMGLIILLLIFSSSFFTQSAITMNSKTSQVSTAITGSVGGSNICWKDILVHNVTDIRNSLESLHESLGPDTVILISIESFIHLKGYVYPGKWVIISNPEIFTRKTYYLDSWGFNEPFKDMLTELSGNSTILVLRKGDIPYIQEKQISISFSPTSQGFRVNVEGASWGFTSLSNLPATSIALVSSEDLLKCNVINEELEEGIHYNLGLGLSARVMAINVSPQQYELLEANGFSCFTTGSVYNSSIISASNIITAPEKIQEMGSIVLFITTIFVAVLLSLALGSELRKITYLTRIRGIKQTTVLKPILILWGMLMMLSVLIGVVTGMGSGLFLSRINYFTSGLPVIHSIVNGKAFSVDIALGLPSPTTDLSFLLIPILTLICVIPIPYFILRSAFRRGVEKIIEFR